METITLKEDIKHTETYDRDDLIADDNEINANDILLAIQEECPQSKITLDKIENWLETCRASKGFNQTPLIYTAECGVMGELITGYLEYEHED